ncbi:MAG: cofactor-independent phosphoglycerate mutase [Candidatus Hydrogenedentes bacterium]|nr:cofactor-independent phosphoglycerate mutase [Candidatus Hydrogenedentota bacterium]
MKYLILVGDGMADYPVPTLGNRTPIEAADTPAMDAVVARGMVGQFCPIPEGLPPGSDIGNLSMFGYNPRESFRGRAPIEAANQGITLADNEVAFRCNLVTLEDGRMRDFTADHISSEEAAELVVQLNAHLGGEFPAVFHPGVSYRHLCIVPATPEASLAALVSMNCTPPHNITDQEYAPHLPSGEGKEMIRAMMRRSQEVLPELPVNQARLAAGKLPATSIWLWGQGKAPHMESYRSKFGLTGAVVSAVDLVKGMGVLAGLDVLKVDGTTGWIDTNYEGKVEAALQALETRDFVFIHLEAPDETAHQGKPDLKVKAIEDFDHRVVARCLEYVEGHPESRMLVAPDHFTLLSTKTHASGPVPFAACGAGIPTGGQSAYSENTAAASGVLIEDGYRLIQQFLQPAPLDLEHCQ